MHYTVYIFYIQNQAKQNFRLVRPCKQDGQKRCCVYWIDKELLLETVKSFKAENDAEGIDWESCRKKYEKIMNILLEIYPKKIRMMKKMILRAKSLELLNRSRITSKLKV